MRAPGGPLVFSIRAIHQGNKLLIFWGPWAPPGHFCSLVNGANRRVTSKVSATLYKRKSLAAKYGIVSVYKRLFANGVLEVGSAQTLLKNALFLLEQ